MSPIMHSIAQMNILFGCFDTALNTVHTYNIRSECVLPEHIIRTELCKRSMCLFLIKEKVWWETPAETESHQWYLKSFIIPSKGG